MSPSECETPSLSLSRNLMCQQESVFVFAREKGTHGTHMRLSYVLQYVAHIVYVHELSYVLHYVAHMRVSYVFHVCLLYETLICATQTLICVWLSHTHVGGRVCQRKKRAHTTHV